MGSSQVVPPVICRSNMILYPPHFKCIITPDINLLSSSVHCYFVCNEPIMSHPTPNQRASTNISSYLLDSLIIHILLHQPSICETKRRSPTFYRRRWWPTSNSNGIDNNTTSYLMRSDTWSRLDGWNLRLRSSEHPIDADDGRFDTGKSPRNINKRPISPSAAKDIFQRLHWKTIDNNIRCNISCIDDVKMLVDDGRRRPIDAEMACPGAPHLTI